MSIGIYIHIPFCISKCKYCDFNSAVADKSLYEAYVEALCAEIKNAPADYSEYVDTVYFGGGTPTALDSKQLIQLLDSVRQRYNLSEDCEITTECNPATMGYDGLRALVLAGFNRISIGMQSGDDTELKTLGRIHSFNDCRECINSARKAGFDNLSLDLMFGLPNQDMKSWKNTITLATSLNPDHLSCYSLKIEDGTPFADMDLNIADDDQSREMYDTCVELLAMSGYRRYEISNFAKPNYESRHNCKYWKCDDFIGFGAGVYSCANGKRFSNVRNTDEYIRRIKTTGCATDDILPLSMQDKMSEFIYLGLRMDIGISESDFEKRFGISIKDIYGPQIAKNIKRGTIKMADGRLIIPPQYIYVSNSILADFI